MTPLRIVIHALMLIVAWGMVGEGAQAQTENPTGHLKKENPDELPVVFVQQDYCVG